MELVKMKEFGPYKSAAEVMAAYNAGHDRAERANEIHKKYRQLARIANETITDEGQLIDALDQLDEAELDEIKALIPD